MEVARSLKASRATLSADQVQVLQAGRVVEQGFVVDIMENPQQEYTKRLLENTPTMR